MKKILFAASRGDAKAGGETYLLLLLRHIDRKRFEPLVLVPREGTLCASLNEIGVETVVEEAEHGWLERAGPWYRHLESTESRVRNCVSLLRERDIDLVHTNSNHRIEAAMAAALCGIPHLYLAHIGFDPEMPIFRRFALEPASYARLMDRLSARIVAVSSSVAASLSPPVAPERIQVVHNGVDVVRFDEALHRRDGGLKRELDLRSDSVLLVAVGRIAYDKGFDLLMDAAAEVLPSLPQLHIALVGGNEQQAYSEQVRNMVAALPDSARIHFLGFRTDVPRILAEADIFALPSRREGHPYVLLEAMASECAVVAAKCPGVEETVVDGRDGLLVAVEDSPGLAAAIQALAENEELRKKLSRNARNCVEQQFNAGATAERMMTVYADILSSCPRPMPGAPDIDLFLRATREIGTLGKEVTQLRERVRNLEQFVSQVKDNRISRLMRKGLHPFLSRKH
jgi:glycosyltransferase involved in cell wall biosynthesis